MGYEGQRFQIQLLARIVGLAVVVTAIGWLAVVAQLRVVPLVLAIVAAGLIVELTRFQRRTHEQLSQVLAAWHAGDLSDRVRSGLDAPGLATLEATLDRIGERLRAATRATESRARYLAEVLNHAPIALLAIAEDRVSPLNAAAHRLLGHGRDVQRSELVLHGATFAQDLFETPVGSRRVTRAVLEEPHAFVLSVGSFTSDGRVQRLIALQDIQGELQARALQAWQDMAQVLAHEITGSLAPVASLSAIAAERLADVDLAALDTESATLIAEAREACAVTARRSESLMRFVSRYREFSALPPPQREPIDLGALIARIRDLFASELGELALIVEPPPTPIRVSADRALLEQVLINLVRNASEAVRGHPSPSIWLRARLTSAGRPALEVSDNGAGVPAELTERIFVPFFTTRKNGAGIGLSLVRLIAQAHGGAVAVSERTGGGATFTLTL